MMTDASIVDHKRFYKEETERIFHSHRAGATGFETAGKLTILTDTMLRNLWQSIPFESKLLGTVIALGGYGRSEMCPHSDFDLMIVFADEDSKRAGSESAQMFLHALWDIGFDIGHSVRTISDCIKLYQTDVDVWASVLESRYVCGNTRVLESYTSAMLRAVDHGRDMKFVTSVLAGIEERHKKYGNSVRLLEPNIKNSAGGLRDVHSLLWIYRATDTEYFGSAPFQGSGSACREMLLTFERSGLISHDEMTDAVSALDFLLRIRHEMHYGATAIRDNLEFATQREIARGLGYTSSDADELRNVERFMREYFLHARVIFKLNQRLTQIFRRGASPLRRLLQKEVTLDALYLLRDGTVCLRTANAEFKNPAEILSAFYWSAVHSAELDPPLVTRIEKSARQTELFTPEMRRLEATTSRFRDIMSLPKNTASALRSMNDCDILGALIPQWAKLVAYVQHSMYHFYTVDAHTLLAIERAELLEGHMGLLGTVFQGLSRRDVLYYALLLHDIEKPSGISGHDARGADTAQEVLAALEVADPQGDVAFLIRNHLVMEQTAFRRNFHAPETIAEFASLFARQEQLDLLLLVTYCDLSAVNRNVWSSWKETVLEELYLRTKQHLERAGSMAISHTEELRSALEKTLSPIYTGDEIAHHFSSFDNDAYVHAFTPDEIERHIGVIRDRAEDGISVSFDAGVSFTLMTVIMKDRAQLLSMLCGVLSANDANIIDAHIFTRTDNIVIDRFRIIDGVTKEGLTAKQTQKIIADASDVFNNRETLEMLFEKHHRRWKRRPKPLMHPNIRIDARFHTADAFTIIDVYGPDTTGFLYKVTQVLAKFGLVIHFAKIGTRGDGIVDSFYVVDTEGRRVDDKEQRKKIREKLVHTINQLITVQLGQ
ncbi:MAG TPA: [protein-PII] uridylyltransferase [Bacteroidota bacterium]|nr:[protein-PII] uridylyltransferase [Bacteroidota bacterium]